MTQFHEGQDIEALFSEGRDVKIGEGAAIEVSDGPWRKGKIVRVYAEVQFPNGTRAMFATNMTQFHEGQDIEVWGANMYPWRKGKIVRVYAEVQFPNGTRAMFDAENIRAV